MEHNISIFQMSNASAANDKFIIIGLDKKEKGSMNLIPIESNMFNLLKITKEHAMNMNLRIVEEENNVINLKFNQDYIKEKIKEKQKDFYKEMIILGDFLIKIQRQKKLFKKQGEKK